MVAFVYIWQKKVYSRYSHTNQTLKKLHKHTQWEGKKSQKKTVENLCIPSSVEQEVARRNNNKIANKIKNKDAQDEKSAKYVASESNQTKIK